MSFPARLPGTVNPNHKLDPAWVCYIRRLYDRFIKGRAGGRAVPPPKMTLRDISEAVGVSHETIRLIGLRRTWKHIPEEP